jgi:hypothetical protein
VDAWFVLLPVALTSAAAALVLAGRPDAGRALAAAVGRALETVGFTLLFFLANLAAGALVTVAVRALGVAFISIYLTADITLLVLSLLQALLFQRWREAASGR